jgi:hypothetical protein
MRTGLSHAGMAVGTVIASIILQTASAQNTSPYWSQTGNSNATTGSKLGTVNAVPLRLFTNNALRVFVAPAGNVGIGTSAPTYKLHVIGAANGIYGSGSTYGIVGAGGTYGVYGSGSSYGLYGYSSSNYGVYGSSGYTGVYGYGTSYGVIGSGGTYGVYGSGTSFGVYGYSSSNYAVYGSSGYLGVYGSGDSYGVYGYSSANYGVYGYSSSGYGVDGTSYSNYGGYFSSTNSYGIRAATTNGYYAGVFDGNVWTSGSYITSDRKMKKNIQDVSNAMDIINQLKPKNYEYLTDGKYTSLNLPKGIHYGLIAQDLEQVLPNLVREAPREIRISVPDEAVKPIAGDGKPSASAASALALQAPAKPKVITETINIKAVNYDELIPIMIKAMQEQQKQIDDLKNLVKTLSSTNQTSSAMGSDEASTKTAVSGAFLQQNAPNPFSQSTTIRFTLPASAKQGQLVIYDMNGGMIKSFTVSGSQNQITMDKGSLTSGNYMYSLIVNGKKVDTKTMVLTK